MIYDQEQQKDRDYDNDDDDGDDGGDRAFPAARPMIVTFTN